ncbi:MAG: hypothetical protein AB7H77_09485 [Bdellovibrionales bacterium]
MGALSFPDPVPGLVIRYSFLWSHEAESGREEGSKDRPCAIVLSCAEVQEGRRPGTKVVVLPITHRLPGNTGSAVRLPSDTKKRLGLDDECSWVVLDEVNEFTWPGPDLRLVPGRDAASISYGQLPRKVYMTIRERYVKYVLAAKTKVIQRSE